MRLAILQQSYGRFGGAERLAFNHFMQMKKMGCDVTLYYTGRVSPSWSSTLSNEAVKRIPPGIANRPERLRSFASFLEELLGYDKIIIHHHVEPVLAFYLSKLLGNKIIWYSGSVFELAWEDAITGQDYRQISPTVRKTSKEFYGGLISRFLLSGGLYGTTSRMARMADIETVRSYRKVIANSHFLARFLENTYRLKDSPHVVYPGADPLLERLANENLGVEENYMLVVGSLIPLKNVETVIRAATSIPTSRLVVVGDGQDMKHLKELSSRLQVSVEFKGTVDREEELARLYRGCKFLVHLSLYEPFGLTPVEAGLFSKPSIVTNRGGPPEVVIDGVTGFIVDPHDDKLISSLMKRLLNDNSLRLEMGKRARENVAQRFTLERSTARLLEEVRAFDDDSKTSFRRKGNHWWRS